MAKTPEQLELPLPVALHEAAATRKVSTNLTIAEVWDKREWKTPILGISQRTLEAYEFIRAAVGDRPLIVVSGFRTPQSNEAVGGSKNSYHMLGRALDISCPPGLKEKMIEAAESFFGESGGIGIYSAFIHIDDRKEKARWQK